MLRARVVVGVVAVVTLGMLAPLPAAGAATGLDPSAVTAGAPGPLPDQPDRFLPWCRAGIGAAQRSLDKLVRVRGRRTADNTLSVYNQIGVYLSNAGNRAELYANVHPAAAMRTAAEACSREVTRFGGDLGLDRRVYAAFRDVDPKPLDADARRLRDLVLTSFRHSGADQDDATRTRVKQLTDEATRLGQTFDANLRDDVRSISVDPAQLAGLPTDYRAAHPPGPDGKVIITTRYPDLLPFLTYASDATARRQLFVASYNRGYPANQQVLTRLLAVRQEIASLRRYADWADLATDRSMAGSADHVQSFIDKTNTLARPRSDRDYASLLARKRQDDPGATAVDQSERLYYEELVKRAQFGFDSQSVRPYLESSRVIEGILALTAKLFDVQYVAVPGARTWQGDVKVYDVRRGGVQIGRVYLDLYPRDGKYQHAAEFPVVTGVRDRQLPEAALVVNFPRPQPGSGPALMDHDDVVTALHEFGHAMHHILGGRQQWIDFSGIATEFDFVEAPSMMLEEWAWDPGTLAVIAHHYSTNQPIPAELVHRMRAADEFGRGTWVRHQLFYAALSLAYHRLKNPAVADLTQLMTQLQSTYSPFGYVTGTHFWASFDHLTGYSARYYTYIWSLVVAKDLLTPFQQRGMLDPVTARRYRELVLAPGGSRDAADLVRNFLGRPFNFDAFTRWLNQGAEGPATSAGPRT